MNIALGCLAGCARPPRSGVRRRHVWPHTRCHCWPAEAIHGLAMAWLWPGRCWPPCCCPTSLPRCCHCCCPSRLTLWRCCCPSCHHARGLVPVAQCHHLTVVSVLPAILRRYLALLDCTATAMRTHGALAALAHGRARGRGIPTWALASP
jgi:hypothetical protein